MVKRETRPPKQPAKPEQPSADSATTGTSDLMPDRVATPEKCRAETVQLFEEIETYQGKAVAKGEAEYIYKRFGDPAEQRREENKQSLKPYQMILARNTFELLQASMGKGLRATTAAKKIYKLHPKDFSSVEAVEKTLKRLGLGARKGRRKKKLPPT
jgi:hypothetical protein